MTKSPMLWGAGLACALGGAIAGNALGSTPVLDRSTIGSFYQAHETAPGDQAQREPLPDHYPLVTRAGTVPVGELSMRGLYSQRRYRALAYYADYVPTEAMLDDRRTEWQPMGYARADEPIEPSSEAIARHDAERGSAEPAEALQLAGGPATVQGEGNAKLVDVKAVLAMR